MDTWTILGAKRCWASHWRNMLGFNFKEEGIGRDSSILFCQKMTQRRLRTCQRLVYISPQLLFLVSDVITLQAACGFLVSCVLPPCVGWQWSEEQIRADAKKVVRGKRRDEKSHSRRKRRNNETNQQEPQCYNCYGSIKRNIDICPISIKEAVAVASSQSHQRLKEEEAARNEKEDKPEYLELVLEKWKVG